jgi:hypothetical protein
MISCVSEKSVLDYGPMFAYLLDVTKSDYAIAFFCVGLLAFLSLGAVLMLTVNSFKERR